MQIKISSKAVLAYRTKEDGTSAILLQVILSGKKVTFPVGFSVDKADFKDGSVRYTHPSAMDINTVINDMKGRVIKIATEYYLRKLLLTPDLLRKEFTADDVDQTSFIEYAKKALHARRNKLDPKTVEQNKFALLKLWNFKPEMTFGEINTDLIHAYEAHEKKVYGNSQNTVNKTLACWKKYLRLAELEGVKFSNPFKFYKIKSVPVNKTYLSEDEVSSLYKYYQADQTPINHKNVLRYFLFSCFTGLRISDITRFSWDNIHSGDIRMIAHKNRTRMNKMISVPITAEKEFLPEFENGGTVFNCYADPVTNRYLKEIATAVGIKKNVSYHMSRHTFSTNYLNRGGSVEVLKELLGHSDIKTTMAYVHMTDGRKKEQKANVFGTLTVTKNEKAA